MLLGKVNGHRLMNVDSSAYHDKLQKILEAQADGEEKRVSKEDNDPQLIGEAKSAMHDMLDIMDSHSSDKPSLEERVS